MEPVAPTPPAAGPWVQHWLSPARLARYRTAANGDLQRALELYEWNAKISAALMRDLGHVEIGLRNAYADVIEHYWSGTRTDVRVLALPQFVRSREDCLGAVLAPCLSARDQSQA